jgi:hypothetical protein
MKKVYKLGLFAIASLALLFGCKDGDTVFDQIVANETRGAALRTVELISNELPIGVADAGFSALLEVQDQENGQLAEFVEVYIGFRDNTVEEGAPDLSVPEALYETVSAETFETGEFGYPRFTYDVTLAELLTFTGTAEDAIFGGDQFEIRFELVLTTGQRFSFEDNTGTLTGSFFSSPFLYTPTVVCPVLEEEFVGEYLLVSPTSPAGGVPVWEEQVVTLSIGETSTQRVFSAIYLEALGIGNGANSFTFDLVCETVTVPAGQASGLQCTDVILFGPAADGSLGSYVQGDDSSITIVFAEDQSSGCGGPWIQTATLTKVVD